MDDRLAGGVTRRDTLRRTAALGVAATIAWATGARAQAGKLAKDAVNYVDKGDAPGRDCDDCMHFIVPATPRDAPTCRIVDGPISPHGHCIAFTPKARPAP